ncbi:hypothetical protein CDCA_CDCA05G1617 [Cyanidium caldarium]|uniref:Uncharacterized protein n=1 Tax=Cyanidium caldarium TaxID=2771 RepID=A0AAV9ITD7_CYACA|nr:hypothetical protein CDCA_CDCA05G1617 [Cyanidium caldarium]
MLGFVSSFVGGAVGARGAPAPRAAWACGQRASSTSAAPLSKLRMEAETKRQGERQEEKETGSSTTVPVSSAPVQPGATTPLRTSANTKLGQVTQARLRKVGDLMTNPERQIEAYRVPPYSVPGRDSEVSQRTERLYRIMRQVFGNGHLFGTDLVEVNKWVSCYTNGELSTKEFVRALAKTETYKDKFWHGRAPFGKYGAVELAFKHLLGRRTFNAQESAAVQAVYHSKGYDAMIDHIIDMEYDKAFPFKNDRSDNIPHWREAPYYMGRKPEPEALQPGLERATGGLRAAQLYEFRVRLGSQNLGVVAGGMPPNANLKNKTGEQVFRVVTAGYREPMVNGGAPGYSVGQSYTRFNKFSKVARSTRTYLVPFSELMQTYSRIYKSGGYIRRVDRV